MHRPEKKARPDPGRSETTPGLRFPAWVWLAAGMVGVLLVVYLPALRGGYIWDDDDYVTKNLTLRSVGGLGRIWGNFTATPQYYPLVFTTFWLEYHLWGLQPLGYHVVNVLLHGLAAVLLWRVLVRLEVPGAWIAAAVFALHPVAVESVAWVTERKNVLSAVFYFASALACLRWLGFAGGEGKPGRAPAWSYVAGFLFFLAALLSKTVTCSLPAALLLVIWWKRGRITRREAVSLAPWFVAGAALGVMTAWLERTRVGALGPEWALSFGERCLIAGRAVWFYAGKLIWPGDLAFIYPRWHLDTGAWWQWMFPVAAMVVAVMLFLLRGRLGRGPVVAVLFFGGTLLPALGFTNIYPMRYSFVADHVKYLAGLGLMVPAGIGLAWVARRAWVAPVAVLLVLAALTWRQTRLYTDQITLWQDTLAKNPDCWMAHANLGLALDEANRPYDALDHYQEAKRIKPDSAEMSYNLGSALMKLGRVDEATGLLQEAIRLKPDYARAYNNLGSILVDRGRIEEAVREFQTAIRLQPELAEVYNNLGSVLGRQGRLDEAIHLFQTALRMQPDVGDVHRNLGLALAMKGRIEEAIAQFQEALRLNPKDEAAQMNLARALADREGSGKTSAPPTSPPPAGR